MYTYLNQKYGLKNLIVEWATALVNGIHTYHQQSHDVSLFGKILKNQCDEEFRFIQMHVKDTLYNLLKVLLKDKYPFKVEVEIVNMLDQIQSSTIEEWMWRKIIEKMYDPQDSQVLEQRFWEQIEQREEEINSAVSQGAGNNLYGYHPNTGAPSGSGVKPITEQQIAQFLNSK